MIILLLFLQNIKIKENNIQLFLLLLHFYILLLISILNFYILLLISILYFKYI